jgi:secreted trypsin-like serine protease
MKFSHFHVLLLCFGLFLAACGEVAQGEPEAERTGVVHLRAEGRSCSGTLIAPYLVLTARHCISDVVPDDKLTQCERSHFDETQPPFLPDVFLTTSDGSTVDYTARAHARTEQVAITDSQHLCGNDIALLILDRSLPAELVKPIDLRLKPQTAKDESYELLGFGRTKDDPRGSRTRRSHYGFVECVSSLCQAPIGMHEFMGQSSACSGDSGGPALDLDGRLMGILSRSAVPPGDICGGPSIFLMVEPLAEWIKAITLDVATERNLPLPDWAQP